MAESMQNLQREIQRMSAQLELQHRHISVLEERLRQSTTPSEPDRDGCEASMPIAAAAIARHVPSARPARPSAAIWPARTDIPDPLMPKPGFANFALKGAPQRIIGISVCGFDRPMLENVIALVERQQSKKRDFVPVFLTDSSEFECFRHRGYVFEYLPPLSRRRLTGAVDWQNYANERLDLLKRKWGFAEVIVFGKQPFAGVAEDATPQQASPILESPLGPTATDEPDGPAGGRRNATAGRAGIVIEAPPKPGRLPAEPPGDQRRARKRRRPTKKKPNPR